MTERRSTAFPAMALAMLLTAAAWTGSAPGAEPEWAVPGRVLEKGTRRPVAAAEVHAVEDEERTAFTDHRGEFRLALPGPGRFRAAAALGFASSAPAVVTAAAQAPAAEVTLYLSLGEELPEVGVRAARHPDRVAKTSLRGEELARVPGSGGDPVRALHALPGVAAGNDVSGAPAIRGSRPGDNRYYLDFLPVGYLSHLGGVVSVIPGDLVDDFYLFAAAFGPEYGDGIGAVIDVALRAPRPTGWGPS